MLFWPVAAILTAIVTLAAVWPLLGRQRPAAGPSRAEHDVEVYGAQLSELKGDIERGSIPPAEAESARAEIGRRLLKAAALAERSRATARGGSRRLVGAAAVLVALALPAVSIGLYARYGSPQLPDFPLAARLQADPAHADIETLVAKAEERLKNDPKDGRGWDVLAPIYLRMARPDEAATAFRNAIRLLGSSPARQAGLGEALTQVAGGRVTAEAKTAFEAAVKADPDFLPAKFFLALNLSQQGDLSAALPAWQALIAESPPEAPWMKIAEAALADARQRTGDGGNGTAGAPAEAQPAPSGPTPEAVAAAEKMPAGDRHAMIEGMVARLAERLKTSPDDLDGWKRLIRSYAVLGEPEKAEAATAEARKAFAPGSKERQELDASLGSAETPAPAASAGAPAPSPGSSEADVAAAQGMSKEDRSAMIEGMVARLAERLKSSPQDVEGWKRLIRSYTVLGDAGKAATALRDATAAFPEGSKERAEIAGFAEGVGVSAPKETTTQ